MAVTLPLIPMAYLSLTMKTPNIMTFNGSMSIEKTEKLHSKMLNIKHFCLTNKVDLSDVRTAQLSTMVCGKYNSWKMVSMAFYPVIIVGSVQLE
jgi:hypothetical protein